MRQAGRRTWTHLWAPAAERREVRDRAEEALRECGLTAVADLRTGELSTGQRRLVELARVDGLGPDCDYRVVPVVTEGDGGSAPTSLALASIPEGDSP